MRISPELGGVSVVMIGHFNPSIFSPLWFQKLGLATENEVGKAEIAMIHPEVAIFKLGTKDIHVQLGQFMAQSSEAPWINLADFVVRTFGEFLPHTPISQIGINRSVHFSVGSEDVRNRIGRMLAPTKPWGEWGAEIERSSTNLRGGVITLIMHEPWVEGEFSGRYEARVEPSTMIGGNLGIFVNVNHHCELVNPGTSVAADKIIGFLQTNFDDSIKRSEWIIDQVMSLKEEVVAVTLQKRLATDLDTGTNVPMNRLAAAFSERVKLAKHKAASVNIIGQQKIGGSTTNSDSDLEADQRLRQELKPFWIPTESVASRLSLQPHQDNAAPRMLSLEPLQEWEGYVSDVGEKTFRARLVDLTANQKFEEELAEFAIEELSDDNAALLREGAVFRWVIGYQRSESGTKRRVSEVVFRRLPGWTRKDLSKAQTRANALVNDIAWQ